jgi:hypothetical protein
VFNRPDNLLLERRTFVTTHTVADITGTYTVRLTHAGGGLFNAVTALPFDDVVADSAPFITALCRGGHIYAQVTGQGLEVYSTTAIDLLSLETTTLTGWSGGVYVGTETTTTQKRHACRQVLWYFGCWGARFSVQGPPQPGAQSLGGISTSVKSKLFCRGLPSQFASAEIDVTRPAGGLFPLTITTNMYSAYVPLPFSENVSFPNVYNSVLTGTTSFDSATTYPAPPADQVGYGYSTTVTIDDLVIKMPGEDPVSLAPVFASQFTANSLTGNQEYFRGCSEWLTIS